MTVRVALVAPGLSPLPPQPSTSVEIYLYDLWRFLHRRVDVRLYAHNVVLESPRHAVRRRRLTCIAGTRYVTRVSADIQATHFRSGIVQVDNRPQYVREIARKLPHAKLVLGLHSMTFLQPQQLPRSMAVEVLATVRAIVVNSQYVKRALTNSFPDLQKPVQVIYPGVDSRAFHPCHTRKEQNERSVLRLRYAVHGAPVILFVGRVIERKGVHIAIRALRELHRRSLSAQPPVLWIAGHAPVATSQYGRLLRQLAAGLPVVWLGYIKRERLPVIYRAADVLICPSQKPEAFGLVNLEAQASGLPVVASDGWGIQESVADGETGSLISAFKDPVAFAEEIVTLLANRKQYQRFAKNGIAFVKDRFTWERTAKLYATLYAEILRQ